MLIIVLIFIPLQVAYEELLFRGYLLQGIGIYINHKWVPILVTGILFGLLHSFNPEINEYGFWQMQGFYMSFGIFMAVITIMDNSLELALGLHAANNIFSAIIISYPGSAFQTPALFKADEFNPILSMIFALIALFIFTLIAAKKYKWKNWEKIIK